MAHFIGYLHGSAYVEASRLGSKKSGIRARVQGWKVGVKVEGRHAGTGDRFTIHATGGSDREVPDQPVAVLGLKDDGELFVQLAPGNPILTALEGIIECFGAVGRAEDISERAVELENFKEAILNARRVIDQNRTLNSAKKVEVGA